MPERHAERLSRLRAALERRGLDGLLVSQPESRFYLSGYSGHDLPPRDSAGSLLITAGRALLFTDPRTTEQAEHEAPSFEVITYASGDRGPQTIAETARGLGELRRLAFEALHLPYGTFQSIQAGLDGSGVQLTPGEGIVDELRIVKDESELVELQAAIDVLDRCFLHVVRALTPGQSEREIARQIALYLFEHADGTSFPSIVASGPSASVPHAVPGDRLLQEGEGLKIDIGARAGWYCSDMTRTICLGSPRDPRLPELHA